MSSGVKTAKIWELLKNTFQKFREENTMGLAAALAYYTIFSLPPLLIIIIHLSGVFFSESQVQKDIFGQLGDYMGKGGVQQLSDTIGREGFFKHSLIATVLSLITLFFTSTSLFTTIQNSLNLIFRVKAKPKRGYVKMIRDRTISFGMIILLSLLLLLSLVMEAALKHYSSLIDNALPRIGAWLVHTSSHMILFILVALLFGLIFKFLPDAKIKWKDTIVGSLVTSALFSMGKLLIGYYIGASHLGSIYDAAGSVLVLLVWIYYTSIIFFFGAQFTYVYARFYGSHIRPASYAVRIIQQEIELEEDESLAKSDV